MDLDAELERCVREEYPRLVRVVSLVTGSTPIAEDAVQEALARAWERASRGERFTHLPGWVVTVALNQARSGHRRTASEREVRRRLAASSNGSSPPPGEAPAAVRAAITELPRRQRDVVVLFYLLDLDVAGTAELLGVSTGTVKTALARARSRLAVLLDDWEVDR